MRAGCARKAHLVQTPVQTLEQRHERALATRFSL
jgi:hypothetical protein